MHGRFVVLLLVCVSPLSGQDGLLDARDRWSISPNGGRLVMEDGRSTLQLTGGAATLRGFAFESGTIAFEMRLTARPAFVGIRFRADGDRAEHVYFRPHRSGNWDAIQYQPIMNGSTTWQLYQVEGFSQTVDLPTSEWISVRLEVRGAWAELYVGPTTEPTMRLRLEHGVSSGGVAFTAGFRDGNPDGAVAGAFRGLRVTRAAHSETPVSHTPPTDDFIRQWTVSDPVAVDRFPITEVPDGSGADQTLAAERHGVVNVNRFFRRVEGAERSAVAARVTIEADRSQRVPLNLDFSDRASVFLNGDLLFSGVNDWQSRYPYYLGGLRPDALPNTVWLSLREGPNRLTVVVADQAFGWGFVARLERRDGLHVAAR